MYFGWGLWALTLVLIAWAFWFEFAWPLWTKSVLIFAASTIFLWIAHSKITERLRPSFVFIAPGLLLNGDTWDFAVNHEQIGNDLLVSLPKPQVPKPTPKPKPEEAAKSAFAEPKEIPAKLLQFSHMVNESIANFGVGNLKARAGYVTVKLLDGRQYQYEHNEFENLYRDAQAAFLIR